MHLLFAAVIHSGERASVGCISPTAIASLISPRASLKFAPLRSPLSSGEGFVTRIRLSELSEKCSLNEPSPLERGDRSGKQSRILGAID